MQDMKSVEDQHPAVGPGVAGALGSLFKVGGNNRGQRRRGRRGARIDGVKSGVNKMR